MKVILCEDLEDLGMAGDVVDVAKGHARNYLIPKGIGLEVTPENLKAFEMQRKKIEVRRLKAQEEAQKVAQRLEGTVINFSQKAGEEGKLYGSVTSMDIASRLEKEGIVIDRRKVVLEKPIKALGDFDIPIKIHPGVTATVKVVVTRQGEE